MLGYIRQKIWIQNSRIHHPKFRNPFYHSGSTKSRSSEWSRILWSLAKTGLVPLRRNNVEPLRTTGLDEDEEQDNDTIEYIEKFENNRTELNLGGIAQARRPNQKNSSVASGKKEKGKPSRNRKPTHRDQNDDDEVQIIKKKQSMGLPWFFNLAGQPGKVF